MTYQVGATVLARDDRAAWEKAEVERSAVEARQAEAAGILLEDYHVRRYLNPPADTPYALEYAYSLLGDVRGKTVLDFGCGSGANTVLLRARGARVIALDISPHLLELARKRLVAHGLDSETECVAASAHEVPLRDHSVDVVFGTAVLHHLDLAKAAAEVKRVLQPGGFAVFLEPVRDSHVYVLVRRVFPTRAEDVSPYEYPLSYAQIDAFRKGFTPGPSRRFTLPGTTILGKLGAPESLTRLSRRFDAAVLKALPQLHRWATIEAFRIDKPATA